MKRIKQAAENHPYLCLFTAVTLGILAVFGVYLLGLRPFTINNDQVFEYTELYREWVRLIEGMFKGKGLPMYSWNTFLGNDFYASMAFYTTGDIFLPLYFLFGNVQRFLFCEMILCVYISAFAMYRYLRISGIRRYSVRFFISMIWAFGGWAVLFFGQYMFQRFFAFIPLLFAGAEQFFRQRKRLPFILASAVLFYHSFYYMWPLSLFLLIWAAAREAEMKHGAREFLQDAAELLGCYLVGFLLSGFLSVPAILYILSNPRIGHSEASGIFWPLKVTVGYIMSFVTAPFPLYSRFPNIFQINDNAYGYWYSQFITIIPLTAAFSYIRKNRIWALPLCGLLAAVLIKPLSSAMHGFSDASMRWNFVIEFLMLALAARRLDEDTAPRDLKKPGMIYLCICALLAILLPLTGTAQLPAHLLHMLSIAVCLSAGMLTLYLLYRNRTAAYILSLVQVIAYAALMCNTWYIDVPDGGWRINESMMRYLQDTDDELIFRTQIGMEDVIPSGLNMNTSLKYDYLSARTYESTYDTNILPFLELCGTDQIRLDITDPWALNALGVKYWLAKDEASLPPELSFEYVSQISDLSVYRSLSYRGFGYTMASVEPLSALHTTADLEKALYCSEEDLPDYAKYGGEAVRFSADIRTTNYLAGSIELSSPNILYIAVPDNSGWTVRDNGAVIDTVPVNLGFMGIPLEAGSHRIELSFMTPGLKAGILCTGAGFVLTVLIFVFEYIQRKRSAKEK